MNPEVIGFPPDHLAEDLIETAVQRRSPRNRAQHERFKSQEAGNYFRQLVLYYLNQKVVEAGNTGLNVDQLLAQDLGMTDSFTGDLLNYFFNNADMLRFDTDREIQEWKARQRNINPKFDPHLIIEDPDHLLIAQTTLNPNISGWTAALQQLETQSVFDTKEIKYVCFIPQGQTQLPKLDRTLSQFAHFVPVPFSRHEVGYGFQRIVDEVNKRYSRLR